MNVRFYDDIGNEIRVTHPGQFAAMVRAGRIQAHTMMYDEQRAVWQVAGEFPEFHAAFSRPQPDSYQGMPSYAMPPGPQPSGDDSDAAPLPTGSVLFNNQLAEPQRESTWPSLVALLAIIAGGILLFVVSSKYSTSASAAGYRVGIALGISFWVAVGSYLVWRFMLDKKKGFGMLMFGCGFLLVSVFVSLTGINESRAEQLAEEDLSAIIRDVMNGRMVEAKDYDEKKYGKVAGVIQVLNNYVVQMQTDMQNMNKEMQELHLETLLAEETLKNAETIATGQDKMRRFREMLDRYEASVMQRTLEIPEKIQKTDMDERVKREFLAGFNSTKDEGIRNLAEFFSIERSFASKAEEIFDFLKSRQGRYKWSNSLIYFQSTSDERGYNELIDDIQQIARQEDEWRRNTANRLQQRYDKMQRGMNKR